MIVLSSGREALSVPRIDKLGLGFCSSEGGQVARRPESSVTDLDAKIESLYGTIRDLVVRSHTEPGLRREIGLHLAELRRLQELEASEIWKRFEERRHLKPGSGWRLLEEAKKRLANA